MQNLQSHALSKVSNGGKQSLYTIFMMLYLEQMLCVYFSQRI